MVLPDAETQTFDAQLNLLYDWDHSLYPPQWRPAVIGAVGVHVILVLLILLTPSTRGIVPVMPTRIDFRKSTPLYAPRMDRFEITQKAPNQGKIQKEVTLEALLPKAAQAPKNAPPTRQYVPAAPQSAPQQQMITELPKLPPAQGNPQIELPNALPPIPVNEKPKLAFETPGATSGTPSGMGKIPIPNPSVSDAVRSASRGRTGGVVVSDVMDMATGAGATLSATPNRGRAGSSLELLSDPQGVDFKPYLIQVLAAVRRNWFAVLPESARLGQRGRVVIQFAISREGRVPKLVISAPSGADALDRAAVAGISASNPFPALPHEFKGEQIRLQLSFMYNQPVN